MLQDCKMLPERQRDGRYLSPWLPLPGMDTLPSKIASFHTSPFLCARLGGPPGSCCSRKDECVRMIPIPAI